MRPYPILDSLKKILAFIAILGVLLSVNPAWSQELGSSDNPIKTGVIIGVPFSGLENGKYTGLTTHLFKEIAEKNGWHYKFISMGYNVNAALNALKKNEIDILIGPISVSHERVLNNDFSRPYYVNKVTLVTKQPEASVGNVLKRLFMQVSSYLIAYFFLVLLILSTVIWLLERKRPESTVPDSAVSGIALCSWFLLVQFLRGGYSFSVRHKSPFARGLLVIWLLFSLITMLVFSSLLTAFLTTDLLNQQPQIQSPNELNHAKLGYIQGSGSLRYIKKVNATEIAFESSKQALQELSKKDSKIVGFVDDYLVLKVLLEKESWPNLKLSNFVFSHDEFAFALPLNSPLTKKINLEITRMQDENDMFYLCHRYLGNEAKHCEL